MKAITLRQPWASLIAIGEKRIETRSWPTKYRGPLAVHAAKSITRASDLVCFEEPFRSVLQEHGFLIDRTYSDKSPGVELRFPVGVVIATCEIINCIPITEQVAYEIRKEDSREYAFGDYTPGRFAWILSNIKPLPEPIPAIGRQGLWNFNMPEVG